MMDADERQDLLRNILVGMGAGLSAAWAMNRFQALLISASERLGPSRAGGEEETPATLEAAERVSEAATGQPVPSELEDVAESAVHYGFGAALGGLYGVLGTWRPEVRAAFGTAYGAAAALIADETLVPALGLAPPPHKVPAPTHAYAFVSHLVFGAALEGSRRIAERAIARPGA